MPRTNKKTRIRLLPPRLQLRQKDALTGSFPANVRIASDNRTGDYKVQFNDTKTVVFQTFASGANDSAPRHLGTEFEPIVLYNLDGNINDQSGNGLHLSVFSGSLQFTDGPFDGSQAALFDSFNSLTSSMDSSLQVTGALTIEALIKPTVIETPDLPSFGNFPVSIGGVGETLQNNVLASITINADSKLGSVGFDLERASGTDFMGTTDANVVKADRWYHIAIARDNSFQSNIYVDGILVATASHTNYPEKAGSGNTQNLWVGTQPTGGGNYQQLAFKGAVSNVKVIDRELTAEEVKEEFNRVFPTGIVAGVGFPASNEIWIGPRQTLDLPTTGGIASPGVVRPQVIEGLPFFHFTPGQNLTPFRDSNNPAVDGKSTNESFYATGSNPLVFGTALQQPLWSKTKIEIPIGVETICSASLFLSSADYQNATRPETSTDGLSYEMLYYNFSNKVWEGVGTGTPTGFVTQGAANIAPPAPFGNHIMYGFTPGIIAANATAASASVSGAFAFMNNAGRPTNTFGFPFHPKYHATSSQTLNLSDYISEPFLVEKVVVELSAAYTVFPKGLTTSSFGISDITDLVIPAAINNFFILNQRPQVSFTYEDSYQILGRDDGSLLTTIPSFVTLSAGASAQRVTSVRDVITWGGISSFAANIPTSSQREPGLYYFGNFSTARTANPKNLLTRDFSFESAENAVNDLTPLSWAGRIKLELLVKSPNKNSIFDSPNIDPITGTDRSNYLMRFQAGPGTFKEGVLTINYSGPEINYKNGNRNGLGLLFPNGRSFKSEVGAFQTQEIAEDSTSNVRFAEITPAGFAEINPYLLQPSDRLVVGWQQPITDHVKGIWTGTDAGVVSEIKFLPGEAKIVLYGSQLNNGEEEHRTLNQLLTSEAVHEVIE